MKVSIERYKCDGCGTLYEKETYDVRTMKGWWSLYSETEDRPIVYDVCSVECLAVIVEKLKAQNA